MLKFNISPEERDYIEGIYFEKCAKDNIFSLISERNKNEINNEIFERVYKETIETNIKYNTCFNYIASKYLPENFKYKNMLVNFRECTLTIEEDE